MHGLEFSLPSQMLFFEQSWARDPQESMSMLHFFKKNFAESVLVVFFQCLVVPVTMRSPGLRNIQWSRDHCCSIQFCSRSCSRSEVLTLKNLFPQ